MNSIGRQRDNFQEAQRLAGCDECQTEIRRWVASNGAIRWREQCPDCGKAGGMDLAKARVPAAVLANPTDFDVQARAEYHDRLNKALARLNDEERAAKDGEWWSAYNQYLRTPQWQAIRGKVLARANHICEGCGAAPAVIAHHKTYDRVFHEMLFDLVAVCGPCHDAIHRKDGAA